MIRGYIEDWCRDMNKAVESGMDYGEMLHIKYEEIHPFVDGNGRTGRMFWNWFLLSQGKDLKIIHEGAEQLEYYKIFK